MLERAEDIAEVQQIGEEMIMNEQDLYESSAQSIVEFRLPTSDLMPVGGEKEPINDNIMVTNLEEDDLSFFIESDKQIDTTSSKTDITISNQQMANNFDYLPPQQSTANSIGANDNTNMTASSNTNGNNDVLNFNYDLNLDPIEFELPDLVVANSATITTTETTTVESKPSCQELCCLLKFNPLENFSNDIF
jgi:hypothetical protein